MTVQKVSNYLIYCLAADTKPTTMANNALAYVVDTGDIYKSTGGSWSLINDGPSTASTQTNKTINASNNTITDTSTALGDILISNGTKFTRLARGSTNQVLASTATTIGWSTFNAENTGIASASGNGSTTVFNIAHSIGAAPTVYFADCISHGITITVTVDTTNIICTFASAPPSGSSNVKIYWRAIA